uniref:Reverse transcriptase domain-containing protein n=1 Tax=Nothobranchius rachovii TaxID=451742 RepID=A0A1A8RNC6_9TELE
MKYKTIFLLTTSYKHVPPAGTTKLVFRATASYGSGRWRLEPLSSLIPLLLPLVGRDPSVVHLCILKLSSLHRCSIHLHPIWDNTHTLVFTHTQVPPGRPIVSDCSSESYGSAEFIDYFLNPLSITHPSYVKDTYDFIQKMETLTVPESSFLFTMDVESLYTNIETDKGMAAIQKAFQDHPDPKRPDKEILELLHINLTCNDFNFNEHTFLQIKGTAMGKRFSPAYANIYMADWEQTAFDKCTKKPLMYLRFLDDIWGIWTHSKEDFADFVTTLNNHHSSIKIKPVLQEKEINFLDTITFKGQDFASTHKLDTKVYFKPTDSHALLHKHSFHPPHTFRGIVRAQLLRFRRICSRADDFHEATGTLFAVLRKRGYSRSFLRRILKNLNTQPRTSDQSPIVPLTSFFSSHAKRAHHTIKMNFQTVMANTRISDHKVISAYMKNPNLKDILVKAKLNSKTTPSYNQPVIKGYKSKTGFCTQKGLNHTTRNCVYCIQCKKCNQQYVGETGNTLRTRLYGHIHNIRHARGSETALVRHFRAHGLNNLTISPLESRVGWSTGQRRHAERQWIKRLNCHVPNGLNIR